MVTPPRPVSPPILPVARPPRWLWGIVLAIFGLLIVLAVLEVASPVGKKASPLDPEETAARSLVARAVRKGVNPMVDTPLLERARDTLAKSREKNAAVFLALAHELEKRKIPAATLARLEKESPGYLAYFKAKGGVQRKAAAEALAKTDRLRSLLLAHASGRKEMAVGLDMALPALAIVGLGVMIVVGFVVGWVYWLASARPAPLGHPLEPLDPWRHSYVAIRMLQMMGLYFVATIFAFVAPKNVQLIVMALAIVAGTVAILRLPVRGNEMGFRDLRLNLRDWPRLAGIGVVAWTMTLPITLILGAIGTKINSYFLPTPTHPLTEMMPNATALGLVGMFLAAVVQAAFWEEITFRGFLFPGLKKLFNGSVMGGALTSSFIFAAIHPQGPALWPALASIGFTCCLLAHYTRSLVPGIVLHAVHNGTLLVVGVIATRLGLA